MPIEKLNIVYLENKGDHYPICRLSFVKKNKDLYFIDKSNDNFHISIHKDGNVSLTFQNEWKEKQNIRLFKYNWDLIEEDKEIEKPLLLYLPTSKSNYPNEYKVKNKTASLFLENIDNLNNVMFKYFIISQDVEQPKSRKTDLGVKITKIQGSKSDGQIIDESVEKPNPSLIFDNHVIRFSLGKFDKPEEFSNFKLLFLFQPTIEIDMTYFIKNNKFKINLDTLYKNGFAIKKYITKNNFDITLLVYI